MKPCNVSLNASRTIGRRAGIRQPCIDENRAARLLHSDPAPRLRHWNQLLREDGARIAVGLLALQPTRSADRHVVGLGYCRPHPPPLRAPSPIPLDRRIPPLRLTPARS